MPPGPLLLLATGLSLASPPLPVVDGSPTGAWPAVGALLACAGTSCADFCSGTLVGGRHVLTAAHCLEWVTSAGWDVRFAIGTDLHAADGLWESIPARSLRIHPDFDAVRLDHDLGLVELETAPTTALPQAMGGIGDDAVGGDLTFVGFGVTDDDADDSGVKRAAVLRLVEADEGWLVAEDPTGEANICFGDSGGAVLRQAAGGASLVGVNSWVADQDDTPCRGGRAGAVRLEHEQAWIEEELDVEILVGTEDPPGEATEEGGGSGTRIGGMVAEEEGDVPAAFDRAEAGCAAAPGGARGLAWLVAAVVLAWRQVPSRSRAGGSTSRAPSSPRRCPP